jgi:hypothetical protein
VDVQERIPLGRAFLAREAKELRKPDLEIDATGMLLGDASKKLAILNAARGKGLRAVNRASHPRNVTTDKPSVGNIQSEAGVGGYYWATICCSWAEKQDEDCEHRGNLS